MNKSIYGVLAITLLLGGCMGITGKTVVAKEPPNIFIAGDGSKCMVSQERFDKTEVGMKALCQWRGSGMPAPQ